VYKSDITLWLGHYAVIMPCGQGIHYTTTGHYKTTGYYTITLSLDVDEEPLLVL